MNKSTQTNWIRLCTFALWFVQGWSLKGLTSLPYRLQRKGGDICEKKTHSKRNRGKRRLERKWYWLAWKDSKAINSNKAADLKTAESSKRYRRSFLWKKVGKLKQNSQRPCCGIEQKFCFQRFTKFAWERQLCITCTIFGCFAVLVQFGRKKFVQVCLLTLRRTVNVHLQQKMKKTISIHFCLS